MSTARMAAALIAVVVVATLLLGPWLGGAKEPSQASGQSEEGSLTSSVGSPDTQAAPDGTSRQRQPGEPEPMADPQVEPAVAWWEDAAFLEAARKLYPLHLVAAEQSVASFQDRTGGREAIGQAIESGASLFASEAFPLTAEEIEAEGYLKQADFANTLNRMGTNWDDVGPSIDLDDPVLMESRLGQIRESPHHYPPSLVAQMLLPNDGYHHDPAFIAEAKELYLKSIPAITDAERIASVGQGAAFGALTEAGLQPSDLTDRLEKMQLISPEMQIGQVDRAAEIERLMLDLSRLVDAYYR